MRKVHPQSTSSMYPFPYSTCCLSPRIRLSVLELMFWTTVVISGCSRRRAWTKFFLEGNTGEAVTRTTITCPVVNPLRTRTYRRSPLRVSSS